MSGRSPAMDHRHLAGMRTDGGVNRRRILAMAVGCFAWGAAQVARADESARLVDEIGLARRTVRSMVGEFEQTRRIGLLAADVTSRGKLAIVQPDRLRWELLPPDAVTYWVGPEGLSFASGNAHAKADRETAGPMGKVLDDLLVFLGGDLHPLRARYELVARSEASKVHLEARPRDQALRKIVQRFELVLDRDRVTPILVVVQESGTDSVRIRFSEVCLNVPVDPAAMRPPSR